MQVTQSLKKSVWKTYISYLIPTVIGMVTYSLYCLADVFFVSLGVGSNGLAALNISLPTFTLYSSLAILIGVGASITISIFRGEGMTHKANQVFTLAITLIGVLGICFTLLSVLFTEELAILLGADELVLSDVVAYLIPISYGVLFYMLSGALTVIVRSDGNPSLVMLAGIIGNIINIVLDYIFIIPMGLGTFGAGLATAIGFTISMLILTFHFTLKKSFIHFTKDFLDLRLALRMIKNGIGASILEISTGVTIFLLNLALMRVSGTTAVAIFSVISNIAFIAKGLFGGMAQASQPIISLNYGLKELKVVKIAYFYAMIVAGLSGLIAFVLLAIFSKPIIMSLVSTEPTIVAQGSRAICLYFIGFTFTGLNTVLMYYFQSIESSMYSTLLAFTRGIGLVFLLLLVLPRLAGETGVWLVIPIAETLTFLSFMCVKKHQVDQRLIHLQATSQEVYLG